MKQKIDPNQPVFPYKWESKTQCKIITEPGMTLRQYYAGLAMQGIAPSFQATDKQIVACAETGLLLADALIAELNKETE